MTLLELILVNFAITMALMALLWVLSVALSDMSIVDVFWGPGFVVIAAVTFVLSGDPSPRGWLLLGTITIWGLRLGIHLGRRKLGKPEDFRYREMRDRQGPSFWLSSLAVVFGLQAIVMNLVALPVIVGVSDPASLGLVNLIGLAAWCVGLAFESIGDWQLERFKADPQNAGKVMDRGLWAYTRHPNYFGDFLVWWGIFLISLGTLGHVWTVVSPLLMSILLLRVSGVTLLERSLRARRRGYEQYAGRTSAFFPWPPRASHE